MKNYDFYEEAIEEAENEFLTPQRSYESSFYRTEHILHDGQLGRPPCLPGRENVEGKEGGFV